MAMLQGHGLSSKDCQSVLGFVESSHYQLACQKYFEITHKVSHYVIVMSLDYDVMVMSLFFSVAVSPVQFGASFAVFC